MLHKKIRAELSWRFGKREEELDIACVGDHGVMAQIGSSYSCASIQRLRTLFCQGRQGRWHRLPYGEVSFLYEVFIASMSLGSNWKFLAGSEFAATLVQS